MKGLQTFTTQLDELIVLWGFAGSVRGREPQFFKDVRRITKSLQELAATDVKIEHVVDESAHPSVYMQWYRTLGQLRALHSALTSTPTDRFSREVAKRAPDYMRPFKEAREAALSFVLEYQHFIETVILGEDAPSLVPDVDIGEPGPSVAFQF